jgi:hypothetical protein
VLILLLGTLPTTQHDQHIQVHRLCRAWLIIRRDHHLHQQQSPMWSECAMTVLQQPRCPLVVPVVNDLLGQVKVCPLWNSLKKSLRLLARSAPKDLGP